jgi:type I restriction enzyme S subunit
MSEWLVVPFGNLAELVRDTVDPADVPNQLYVGLEHIGEGSLRLIGFGTAEDVSSPKFYFKEGDILFGKLRPYFRKLIRAPFDGICSTDIWVVRPCQGIDRDFLFYLMASDIFIEPIVRASTGTRMPRAQWEYAASVKLPYPPLPEQRAIARILGALDDKIELNRRMNETLEQLARALFKAWFVDFEPVRAKQDGRWRRGESLPGMPAHLYDLFPDHLVDTEIGEIPEGWEIVKIGDIASVDKGLSYKGEGLTDRGGLPLVNLGCFGGSGIFKAENLKRYEGQYRERHLVRTGDLVMANTDITQNRTVLGSPAIVPEFEGEQLFLFTHHIFAVRFHSAAEPWRRYVYYMLLQSRFREIAESYATGTTVLALPKEAILEYLIPLPSEGLRSEFEQIIENIWGRINTNLCQSRTLAALRDTLLPKLITGELRVREVEKVLEGVVP